ncbi:ABC transporter permease [Naumannella huperziae]
MPEAATTSSASTRSRLSGTLTEAATTLIAIVLAFAVGAVLMIVSDPAVIGQYAYLFTAPQLPLGASWAKVSGAYAALFAGSLGGLGPLTETTAQAAPLICAGLGVAIAFRAGLFNIGAQGQAIVGSIVAAWVGFSITGVWYLSLLLAIVGGILAGAVWGGLAGWLKARFGAHEVIVTIMLNYIAAGLLAWLLTTTAFQRPGRTDPIAPVIDWFATMPRIEGTRLHLGFILALIAAAACWWLLDRSTLGYAVRAVGANPNAAATGGISVPRVIIAAMAIAGGLAGLAGAQAALGPAAGGTAVPLTAGLVGSIGFDAITVALLGRSRPLGVVLAGLLFGALKAGGLAMQSVAQTPLTLTIVLQALIVLFVAAPALVRKIAPFLRRRPVRAPAGPAQGGALS